jgi:branched-chain amino acid aminotransferase
MPEIDESLFIELVKAQVLRAGMDSYPDSHCTSGCSSSPSMNFGVRPETYAHGVDRPVGAYYAEPVPVKIEEHTCAAEGVGRAKTAGNYAASLYPTKLANDEGFHQLIWTTAAISTSRIRYHEPAAGHRRS